MPLTISEHYRGGEIMGNAFAKMGEQYAQYKEKQRETKKDHANTKGAFELFAPMLGGEQYNTPEKVKARMTQPSNMSLDEFTAGMKGEIQAGIMKSAYAKAAADVQEKQERARLLRLQADAMAQPRPMPGSQGYNQVDMPGGVTLYEDAATGERIPASDIHKADKPERRTPFKNPGDALAFARAKDPKAMVVTEELDGNVYIKSMTSNPEPGAENTLPPDWKANAQPIIGPDGKPLKDTYFLNIGGQFRQVQVGANGNTYNFSTPAQQ